MQAQKKTNSQMVDIYVARQPIFDRQREIYGYELLFREGLQNSFPNIDGSTATSKVLNNTFLSSGIESVAGNKRVFINFTRDLLVKNIPLMFPCDVLTVEILEDVEADETILGICQELVASGFEIALDDFALSASNKALLDYSNIVKIDFRTSTEADIREVMAACRRPEIRFLAEKVETSEEYERALELGFQYFQGYFFTRPEIIQGKDLAPSKLSLISIMAEACREECRFEDLENIFVRDVSLAYKLLRYINSAYFRRVQEIGSIRQAIGLLGQRGVAQFTALMMVSQISHEQTSELLVSSIARARLCELLSEYIEYPGDRSEMFSLGLFSLIDVILEMPMAGVMEMLPLPDTLKLALVSRQGELADVLRLAIAREQGDWPTMDALSAHFGVSEVALSEYYTDAVGWADSISNIA